jgi:NADPH2:quinone reductase
MAKMRVIEISEPGGPEVLVLGERDIPAPGHGEIVIKVAFAGVNRPGAAARGQLQPAAGRVGPAGA